MKKLFLIIILNFVHLVVFACNSYECYNPNYVKFNGSPYCQPCFSGFSSIPVTSVTSLNGVPLDFRVSNYRLKAFCKKCQVEWVVDHTCPDQVTCETCGETYLETATHNCNTTKNCIKCGVSYVGSHTCSSVNPPSGGDFPRCLYSFCGNPGFYKAPNSHTGVIEYVCLTHASRAPNGDPTGLKLTELTFFNGSDILNIYVNTWICKSTCYHCRGLVSGDYYIESCICATCQTPTTHDSWHKCPPPEPEDPCLTCEKTICSKCEVEYCLEHGKCSCPPDPEDPCLTCEKTICSKCEVEYCLEHGKCSCPPDPEVPPPDNPDSELECPNLEGCRLIFCLKCSIEYCKRHELCHCVCHIPSCHKRAVTHICDGPCKVKVPGFAVGYDSYHSHDYTILICSECAELHPNARPWSNTPISPPSLPTNDTLITITTSPFRPTPDPQKVPDDTQNPENPNPDGWRPPDGGSSGTPGSGGSPGGSLGGGGGGSGGIPSGGGSSGSGGSGGVGGGGEDGFSGGFGGLANQKDPGIGKFLQKIFPKTNYQFGSSDIYIDFEIPAFCGAQAIRIHYDITEPTILNARIKFFRMIIRIISQFVMFYVFSMSIFKFLKKG